MAKNIQTTNYNDILIALQNEIRTARNNIAKTINISAHNVYWNIGKLLFEKKLTNGYGTEIINRLSIDLKAEFPEMGLSPRNLWDMKKFYERYSSTDTKLRQAVAVLPWGHNLVLMNKIKDDNEIFYYASECSKKAWSRDLLLNAIKLDMFSQQKTIEKSHNFYETLPPIQAEYANEIFQSSYNLGFLGISKPLKETELEKRLIEKIKLFLLELGKDFTFIGNQHRLEYNKKEYFVDILFFHRKLRSLVAIELKIGCFKPEYIGKMNMYLSLLDKQEKNDDENPSIGIILCADKDHLDVEIALQDIQKPIGVAEYQLLIPKMELQELIREELTKGCVNGITKKQLHT